MTAMLVIIGARYDCNLIKKGGPNMSAIFFKKDIT